MKVSQNRNEWKIESAFLKDKYLGDVVNLIDLHILDGAFAGAYIKARK